MCDEGILRIQVSIGGYASLRDAIDNILHYSVSDSSVKFEKENIYQRDHYS